MAALAVCVALAAAPLVASPCPGEHCIDVRPQDEVLLVSVRGLGCSTDTEAFAAGLRCERHVQAMPRGQRWHGISLDEFLASFTPDRSTIVFAHGNRIEENEVRSRSLYVYSRLVACRGDDRPLRYVIFSWPSDEIDGVLRDVRVKAARTRPAGLQLAWIVDQIHRPDVPLGLIGYSFGTRVQSGAAHLLAGGSLSGLRLNATGPAPPMRAVWIAPAFAADWLGPGRYHGLAMNPVETLLVGINRRDPAMRYFAWVDRKQHPQAMGLAGPTYLARETARRVKLFNATSQVGRSHDMCKYMAINGLMSNAWRRLTFADSPPHVVTPMPPMASAAPSAIR
ncbi:MAG: hypothetical protein AAGJ46_19220 [Planctomycetota bacterium]